MASDLQQMPL